MLAARSAAVWSSVRWKRDFAALKAGVEVDFVVFGQNAFHAIEVKNAAKVTRHDASGLEAFHSDYPEATCTLLYRGADPLKLTEHCLALPVEQFLSEIVPNTPLPVVPHLHPQ